MEPEINKDEVRQIMKAYLSGDEKLLTIPDSEIKKLFLNLEELRLNFKTLTSQNEATPEEISQYKIQLDNLTEEEQTKTILHILDTHMLTPELRAILEPHRELLLRIKRVNKDTGKSDPVWK